MLGTRTRGNESETGGYFASGNDNLQPLRSPSQARQPRSTAGRMFTLGFLTALVLAGSLYTGFGIHRQRKARLRNPYRIYEDDQVQDNDSGADYGAIGI